MLPSEVAQKILRTSQFDWVCQVSAQLPARWHLLRFHRIHSLSACLAQSPTQAKQPQTKRGNKKRGSRVASRENRVVHIKGEMKADLDSRYRTNVRGSVCFPLTLRYNHRSFESKKCRKRPKFISTTPSPTKPSPSSPKNRAKSPCTP